MVCRRGLVAVHGRCGLTAYTLSSIPEETLHEIELLADVDRGSHRRPRRAVVALAGSTPMLRALVLLALLLGIIKPSWSAQPRLEITYSPELDEDCSILHGPPIKDDWKLELTSRMTEYQDLWTQVGPKLIHAAEKIARRPFPSDPIAARLTLCNIPSQSFVGVIVNMRYALKSFTADPVPMRYKVDTLFHELLHKFLAARPVRGSALIAAHADEPECVRDHLHLLALQKAALLRIGERDALQTVVAVDGQLPGGCYKRAWALVNATETEYLSYVAEVAR